jgi:hypothetical protein
MNIEWFEGIYMMCHEITEVRHIRLYVVGSEGLFCCKNCENELLEFAREKSREAVKKKKKEFQKRKGGKL